MHSSHAQMFLWRVNRSVVPILIFQFDVFWKRAAAVLSFSILGGPPKEFTADHPFVYFIIPTSRIDDYDYDYQATTKIEPLVLFTGSLHEIVTN